MLGLAGPLRPPAVKDAQRRNGINGGDPPKAGRRPFMPASRMRPAQQRITVICFEKILRIFAAQIGQFATESPEFVGDRLGHE